MESQNKRDMDHSNADAADPSAGPSMTPNQGNLTGESRARSIFNGADQQAFDLASSEIPLLPQGGLDFPFECEDMWAELFATVGLNAQDGFHLS